MMKTNKTAPLKKPGGSNRVVKKLVIKNFSRSASSSEPSQLRDKSWDTLQNAVKNIHNSQPIQENKEYLYDLVENTCLSNSHSGEMDRDDSGGKFLYDKLKFLVTELTMELSASLKRKSESLDILQFLKQMDLTWQSHCRSMRATRSIFLFLDRRYVLQQSKTIPSVWDLGLEIFRDHVFNVGNFKKKTISGILQLVLKERNGIVVERQLIKNLVAMIISLKMYSTEFQDPFIAASREYYSQDGKASIVSKDTQDYLYYVENRIKEENARVDHYLDGSTKKTLINVVEKQLLEMHTQSLIKKGFVTMVVDQRYKELKLMYRLYQRVFATIELKKKFSEYIKDTGVEILEEETQSTVVQRLLDAKTEIDRIYEDCFLENPIFKSAIKESFEHVINTKPVLSAQLIAKFIDKKLKTGTKDLSEEELGLLMDRVMVLFRYIQSKDVFEAFYKSNLAKRLLLGKSASADAERSMLSKLKQECGVGFTHKLEVMFKDVDISRDIMSDFNQSPYAIGSTKSFNVTVLTTGQWPSYSISPSLKIPPHMVDKQKQFESYYAKKYANRVLKWCSGNDHCSLTATYIQAKTSKDTTKEFFVSLYQSLILLLFNDADEISFNDILTRTGIEEEELKSSLLSLACGKVKVLRKLPKGGKVLSSDSFTYNADFKSKSRKIRINQIQIKETNQEIVETTEKVFQDRLYQVDAAIVRIMKTRRELSHTALISECIQQLNFPAKVSDLKKQVESLIEREYLERHPDKSSCYRYLA